MAQKPFFFATFIILFYIVVSVLRKFVTFAPEISKIEPHYGRLFWNRIQHQLYC